MMRKIITPFFTLVFSQIFSQNTTVYIPTVVHVVWNNATQNISDQRVLDQIAQLNADYSRTNSDAGNTPSVWQSIAADTKIQFCLATVDPNGNATNGIIRKQTTTTSFR